MYHVIHERDLSAKLRKDRFEKDREHGEACQSELNTLQVRDVVE